MMARVRVSVVAAGTVKERERNRVKERKKSELGPRLGRGRRWIYQDRVRGRNVHTKIRMVFVCLRMGPSC